MLDTQPAILFVGTAGAGKSTLTAAASAYYQEQQHDVLTVNLDPGADKLPYEPDLDIRALITIDQVMEQYGLGPNGAQVAAADLVAVEFERIEQEIDALRPEVLLVDTPGQLELFAFRASGPYVAQRLSANPFLCFLMDPAVANSPRGFVSQAVLAATTHYRLQVPTLNILGKTDTLADERVERILQWSTDSDLLLDDLAAEGPSMVNQLNESFVQVLDDFQALARLVPVSAATLQGLEEIYALTSNVLAGGEASGFD